MAAQSASHPTGSSSPVISPSVQNPNSSSNPSPLNSYTSLTIHNIGSMVPIKLKSSNYLPWRALFAPIFRRYKLLGIIDGTEVCPSPFLPDRSMNPAFEDWYEKDQNLLIWLNSTLSEEIIPFTVGVSSSRELWVKLEQRFGGVSEAHIHQLRSRLQSIQKGSQSISVYLQQIKEIADSLQAAGASVSDRDLIAATLHGLPDEFESFIDSIMLRLSSTSLDELHGLLLTKELSMARRKAVLSPILTTTLSLTSVGDKVTSTPLLDKEKESDQPTLGINLPSWNGLPGNPFPDCLPSVASKYSSSTVDVLPGKIPHLPEEHTKQVKLILRSMWRQAQQIHVLVHPLLLQKKTYLISSGSKAKVSHIILFPFLSLALALACKTRRKKAISRNLKSNYQSGIDCQKPLPGCLPCVALEHLSSTVAAKHG